jgi:deoxyribonuclease-4
MPVRIGFHVSIAGGISNSVENAQKVGCTAFQIFSRNPRGWAAKPLSPEDVDLFKRKLASSNIDRESVAVHMPYLPNLSGPPGDFYTKSALTLSEEMQRCATLGIHYLVIHLGSHMGQGPAQGMNQLTRAIDKAISATAKTGNKNNVMILLENNAGQKNAIGATFDGLRAILDGLSSYPEAIGVCLDTCHLFASGHDIRSVDGVRSTLDNFNDAVGLGKLKLIHLNDSKGSLGSNLDRHEHIGLGQIGLNGLASFLNDPAARNLPFIMETPIEEKRGDIENMKAAKALIK